jgi:hypothetical protein
LSVRKASSVFSKTKKTLKFTSPVSFFRLSGGSEVSSSKRSTQFRLKGDEFSKDEHSLKYKNFLKHFRLLKSQKGFSGYKRVQHPSIASLYKANQSGNEGAFRSSNLTFNLFDINFIKKERFYTKLKYSRSPAYDIVSGGSAALLAGFIGFLVSEKFGIELVDSGDFYIVFMYCVFASFFCRPLLKILSSQNTI